MRKLCKLLAAAFLTAALFGCSQVKPVPRDRNVDYELVVLHTNDHHGTTVAKNGLGGLAERETFFRSVEAEHENVLKLDAGDVNTGSALSNMFRAEPDILAYNLLGYEAVTFGNHEFDKPLAVLKEQMALSRFDWISANIKQADGSYLGKPYIVRDFEGFRVGVIGLTTLRTKIVAAPDASLVFIDEITAAKDAVKALREKEKADIVIVLGHLGDVLEAEDQTTSIALAENVTGIDLIIDGHSHSLFEEALFANGVPIITANEWGKRVGEAVLTIRDGKVTNFSWQSVPITTAEYPPDAEVSELLAPYIAQAEASLKEVITETGAKFEVGNRLPRYQETALGDLICDATADYVRSTGVAVDFAFHNGGTVRAELPQGNVTKENVLTVLPFENYVYVVTLKGTDLLELFEFIGSIKQGAGAFPQVSKEAHWTVTYNADESSFISDVTVNGAPVDPSKTYKIATNDYLAKGGDGYTVLTKNIDSYNTSMMLSDVVIDYLGKQPHPVMPVTDGRITVIGGITP